MDYINRIFHRLTVKERLGLDASGKNTLYLCQCSCGHEVKVSRTNLRKETTKSCGCMNREMARDRHLKHGKSGTRVYIVWTNMIQRCTNPNHNEYKNYGARGITVCDSWRKFQNFYKDMGEPPTEDHTIERNDVNGSYEKTNCKWIPSAAQSMNTRRSVKMTFLGRTQTVTEWAREYGLNPSTLRVRLRRGMTFAEALTTPVKQASSAED